MGSTTTDGERVQRLINVTDANYECRHGSLPLDRRKPPECDCWPGGSAEALAMVRPSFPGAGCCAMDD